MAVFTNITHEEAQALAHEFELGQVISLEGISAGIENTNYFLNTEQGQYVLTVFERLSFEELPFYIELMYSLSQQGFPAPAPQVNKQGLKITSFKGKPCGIVTRLKGHWEKTPSTEHCAIVGHHLAQMHLKAKDFPIRQKNLRGLQWWQSTAPTVLPHIPKHLQQMLQDEVSWQTEFAESPLYQQLPVGPIHADLFRDNVLFDKGAQGVALGGFIDFYFAGCDTWLFDCAVVINDWCIDLNTGVLNDRRANAFLKAYHGVRPFTKQEIISWPAMLRGAALRFWISRLWDFYLPREAQMLTPHDPTHFERILKDRRQHPVVMDLA